MSDAPSPDEFLDSGYFEVKFDGIDASAYFHEVEGLQAKLEVVEYQEGGENAKTYKLPGQTRFSNIVLRRGLVKGGTDLFKWIEDAIAGDVKRCTGTINVFTRDGEVAVSFEVVEAWPVRYRGPSFDSRRGGDLSVEELEVAHEGLTMK